MKIIITRLNSFDCSGTTWDIAVYQSFWRPLDQLYPCSSCLCPSRPHPELFCAGSEDLNLGWSGFPPWRTLPTTANVHGVYPLNLHPVFASVTSLRLIAAHIVTDEENYTSFRDVLMGLNSLNHFEIQLRDQHWPDTADNIMLPTVQFLHVGHIYYDMHLINSFLESVYVPLIISFLIM